MIKKITGLFLAILLVGIVSAACSTQAVDKPQETSSPAAAESKPKASPGTAATENKPVATPGTAAQETSIELGPQAYEYTKYIDANLPDRDCIDGKNYVQSQQWIISELTKAGYSENDIYTDDFTFESEDSNGPSNTVTAQNISVTKKGTSGKQIIIGAHYDGTGTGDNGSGAALALAAATAYCNTQTFYDLTFVFFSAEEYGLYGSFAYAANMSPKQIEATQYMLNMDSLLCGDYCYLYGGVADFENLTVTKTEAYQNAMQTAQALGLNIRSNPWTFDNPEPSAEGGVPAYPSPITGDFSDHVGFRDLGIPYVYFEATNWEIGDYDGYEETESFGPIMNTDNDYLAKIEGLFPGRAKEHLNTFGMLLKSLAEQSDLQF